MTNYTAEWRDLVKFKEIKYDEFVTTFESTKAIFSRKVDGMLGAFIYNNELQAFQTTTGQLLQNIPVIGEYTSIIKNSNQNINNSVFMGELVCQVNNIIMPFNKTVSVVKTPNVDEHDLLIHHYIYDVLYYNGHKIKSYKEALRLLSQLFDVRKTQRIHFPTTIEGDLNDFRHMFTVTKTMQGYDGVVVRQELGKNYKVKPSISFDMVVIGAGNTEMNAWPKGQISYLIVALMDKFGNYRMSSRVGTGFSEKEREYFFKFANANRVSDIVKGQFMIKPLKVIEVTFLGYDVKQLQAFKFEDEKYRSMGYRNSVTLRHARMTKIRDDKSPTYDNVKVEQVPEIKI